MSAPDMERTVAGIRCRDVLERLSDYVDGALPPEDARRVDAHLRDCDPCERLGGKLGEIVAVLRRDGAVSRPLDPKVERRLRERLARAL